MAINPSTAAGGTEMLGQYIGNYRLMRLLGEGGMGMVFAAAHVSAGGQAAIKILRAEVASRPDITARFFNEAKAANSISHPGIVRVFDCGYTANGIAYLAMEFLEGESLGARLARVHWFPIIDALRIARQISSALQAAHLRHVIHRDLKPDNIMLVPDAELPGGERAKILDFGIAKISEGDGGLRTRSNMVMGTPTYMSPEQCHGAKYVSEKSDVYSLGVILYQMLAGRPPFVGDGFGELAAMHLKDPPPPLQEQAPHVSPPLAALVHMLLEKQESQRPSMESAHGAFLRFADAVASASSDPAYRSRISSPSIAQPPLLLEGRSQGIVESSLQPQPSPSNAAHLEHVEAPQRLTNDGSARVADEVIKKHTHHESPTQPLNIAQLRWSAAEASLVRASEGTRSDSPQVILSPDAVKPFTPLPQLEPLQLASSHAPTTRQPHIIAATERAPGLPPTHIGGRTLTWAASEIHGLPRLLRRGSLGAGVVILAISSAVVVWKLASSSLSASSSRSSPPGAAANTKSSATSEVREEHRHPLQPPVTLHAPTAPTESIATLGPTRPVATISVPERQESQLSSHPDESKLAQGTVPVPPAQLKALAAWKNRAYPETIIQAISCTQARPQNYRCWWLLGMAACHSLNYNLIKSAKVQLSTHDKKGLAEEISVECARNGIIQKSDGDFGPRPVEEKPAVWISKAQEYMQAGKFSEAMGIAEAYTYSDPLSTWSIVGKCACALNRPDEATKALNEYHDTSMKNEIINFCAGRGIEYDAQKRKFKKR